MLSLQVSIPNESQAFLTQNTMTTTLSNQPITPTHGQSSKARSIQMFNAKKSSNQMIITNMAYQMKKGDAKDTLWCDFY